MAGNQGRGKISREWVYLPKWQETAKREETGKLKSGKNLPERGKTSQRVEKLREKGRKPGAGSRNSPCT